MKTCLAVLLSVLAVLFVTACRSGACKPAGTETGAMTAPASHSISPPDPLLNLIVASITNHSSASVAQVAPLAGEKIYPLCRAATNYDALYTSLSPVLANADFGLSSNSLALNSVNVEISEKAVSLYQAEHVATNSNWLIAFSSGAEFLNPYSISVPSGATAGTNGTLKNAGNNTVAYLQFDVLRHWVLARSSLSTNANFNRFPIYGALFNMFSGKGTDFDLDSLTPDFQFTFGFLLGSNPSSANDTNTYSAQTLAGSDIYGTVGAGLPLWRNDQDSDGVAVQISLWGSLGATTEKAFEKVHANELTGGLIDFGIPGYHFGSDNPGLVEAKFGAGHLDFPSTTGKNNQVNVNGNGEPIFNGKWVPEAGANLLIPIKNTVYLNIEANTFLGNQSPGQWNIKVGATFPWSTIQGMFTFIK